MSILVVIYILLMVTGLGWLVYRIVSYMGKEKESDSKWMDMANDEQFKFYVETLKKERQAATGKDSETPAPPLSEESMVPISPQRNQAPARPPSRPPSWPRLVQPATKKAPPQTSPPTRQPERRGRPEKPAGRKEGDRSGPGKVAKSDI